MSEPVWVPLGPARPTIPWQIVFTALANESPPSAFATLDTRNSHPVLDYDAAVVESGVFRAVLPPAYAGNGLNVRLIWMATTAVTGNVVWVIYIERIAGAGMDLDVNSWGTPTFATAACDSVSGETTETVVPIPVANMDGLLAGELFRLGINRSGTDAGDTMAGDAELIAIVITEQ